MSFDRRVLIFISIALTLSLSFGALLHSFVPHNHGSPVSGGVYTHAHTDTTGGHEGSQETSQWASLHNSLHHEDKKATTTMLLVLVILFSSVVLRLRRAGDCMRRLVGIEGRALYATCSYFVLMRRGVLAYRRFR